ncbi:hypothetical protein BD779DRAFT_1671483 [Infundibulicybe gibba]|nr:hypothetical protein BD779DRAFT_1671483 [Infundibulicybe gibba]
MHSTITSLALILLSGVVDVQARESCLQTTSSTVPFTINAVYKQAPLSGPASVAVTAINVYTAPRTDYSILSACATCQSDLLSFILTNGALQPIWTSPSLKTTSFSLVAGESPSFISTKSPPSGFSRYCTMESPISGSTTPVLAAGADSSLWSLCANSTADGRVDVVWSPQANHAHYVKSACRDVYLQVV